MRKLHSGVPREHPVRQVLDAAAGGHAPSKSDLAEIVSLRPEDPEAGQKLAQGVKSAAERILEIRATGHYGNARNLAVEETARIVAPLPELEEPEQDLPDDPRALADIALGDGPDAREIREEVARIPRLS